MDESERPANVGEAFEALTVSTASALSPILAWADSESFVPLVFHGALTDGPLEGWVDQTLRKTLGAGPAAVAPSQADLLVIVGAVAQKAAPILQRIFSAMPEPRLVLHIGAPTESERLRSYALVTRVEDIVPVDVVVEGTHPSQAQLEGCVRALRVAAEGWRVAQRHPAASIEEDTGA